MMPARAFSALALMLAATLGLAACETPNAMPTGYVYHDSLYKSPAPPPSPKATQAQRESMGVDQATQFRDGVYGLLDRLTQRAGLPPQPVYIQKPEPMSAFYMNIDNSLRDSMRHMGYTIADQPGGTYVFAYEAQPITYVQAPDPGAPNVALTLRVYNGVGAQARLLTQETANIHINGADSMQIPMATYPDLPGPQING